MGNRDIRALDQVEAPLRPWLTTLLIPWRGWGVEGGGEQSLPRTLPLLPSLERETWSAYMESSKHPLGL